MVREKRVKRKVQNLFDGEALELSGPIGKRSAT